MRRGDKGRGYAPELGVQRYATECWGCTNCRGYCGSLSDRRGEELEARGDRGQVLLEEKEGDRRPRELTGLGVRRAKGIEVGDQGDRESGSRVKRVERIEIGKRRPERIGIEGVERIEVGGRES